MIAKRLRLSGDDSIPTHFEALPLRAPWRAAGIGLGVVLLIVGLALAATTDGRLAKNGAPSTAVAGLVLLVGTIRLGRAETTVGTVRVECRVGPFRQMLPSGSIVETTRRAASGWRALFAGDEIRLRSDVVERPIVIPTADPAPLLAALDELD